MPHGLNVFIPTLSGKLQTVFSSEQFQTLAREFGPWNTAGSSRGHDQICPLWAWSAHLSIFCLRDDWGSSVWSGLQTAEGQKERGGRRKTLSRIPGFFCHAHGRVHHFGPKWNVSTVGWTAIKFCADVHGHQKITNDFPFPQAISRSGVSSTFPLAVKMLSKSLL